LILVVSPAFGLVILFVPRVLGHAVAFYLIVIGIAWLARAFT
jgi:hypothetical protein